MKEIRVIVAGSRGITDYNYIKCHLDEIFSTNPLFNDKEIIIISGTAKGVDTMGENYAFKRGLYKERYPADWGKYGKRAGYIRNVEMSKVSDIAIVFWDGFSKGSKHMIEIMQKEGKPVIVVTEGKIIDYNN